MVDKVIDRSHHPLKRDPMELWEETARRREYANRLLDLHSDTCLCRRPVPGPRYLKQSKCVRCQRTIRG